MGSPFRIHGVKPEGGPTTSALCSAEEAHLAAQKACEELKQKLSSSEAEKANQLLTMSAEIDDLNRTKTNLEERLIELIRYDTGAALTNHHLKKKKKS